MLRFAVESGIDVDQPFPFLLQCHMAQATFHILCNQSDGEYNPHLHEKAKVRLPIADKSVEIVGFYSRQHRGVFTPARLRFPYARQNARQPTIRPSGKFQL